MTAAMATGLLAGCGGSDSKGATQEGKTWKGIDVSEPVTLTMYLLGDRAGDFDEVYDQVNEILEKDMNTKLDVKYLSWDEMDTKYSLLFSSGEDFDLIFTASGWSYYEDTVAKNGFYEMDEEFRKTYAPDITELLPEEAWEQATINDGVYMVPNYQHEYSMDVVGVRGDLMEKYGYSDITTPEELEAFFDEVAENETDITPMGSKSGSSLVGYFLYPGQYAVAGTPYSFFTYNLNDATDTDITYTVDTDEFVAYAEKMKEFYDKGYWSSDTLSSTDTRTDSWTQGRAAAMVWNLGSVVGAARDINASNPEWNATFVDPAKGSVKQFSPYTNNGVGINASSKNPERAMMVLDELMTNKEIYDLTSLGIEGKHWEDAGDNQYKSLEASANFTPNGTCNWGWTNMEIARKEFVEKSDVVYEKQQETLDLWNKENTSSHPYATFAFNDENVKTEIANINAIMSQYYEPIEAGLVDDPAAAVEELREKLDGAGIQKVYEELQAQAEEFLAAKK